LPDDVSITEAMFYSLIDNVRRHETIYKQAGAVQWLRAAAHSNADSETAVRRGCRAPQRGAIAGQMWLDRIDGADSFTHRPSHLEMVIKATNGNLILVSRSD
jgi:FdhD protein